MIIRADSFRWVPDNIALASIPLVIVDPPYGRILHEQWDAKWQLADQWSMTRLIENALIPGGTAYVWGGIGRPKDRIFYKWLGELEEECGLTIWDHITWRKRRFYGSSKRYGFVREECAMLVKGTPKTFNIPLLDKLRGYAAYDPAHPAKSEYLRRTNVWDDVTELFRGKIHPAEKPSRLAEIMIETSSNPGDTVLDFFAGCGSTGVAAQKLNRNYILVEQSDCEMRIT